MESSPFENFRNRLRALDVLPEKQPAISELIETTFELEKVVVNAKKEEKRAVTAMIIKFIADALGKIFEL